MAFDAAYFANSIVWAWRVELLLNGSVVDTLTAAPRREDGTVIGRGITGGGLSWSIYRDVRDEGNLELRLPATDAQAMSWDRYLVRVCLDMVSPTAIPHVLGVFLPTVSKVSYGDGWASFTLDLHGLTTYLQQARPIATYSMAAGANVAASLNTLLQNGTTYGRVAVTPSALVASADRSWPLDQPNTYLRIANDLCASLGYFSMYTSPDGWLTAQPYTNPGSRTPLHEFADDSRGLYLRGWTVNSDTWSIPNIVVARQRTNGDTVPLSASFGDASGTPYSYDKRGRWIYADPIEVDAPDTATLTAAATSKLRDLQAATTTMDFTYGFLPLIEHDAVLFTNRAANLSAAWTISSRSIRIGGSALVKATIRRVPS